MKNFNSSNSVNSIWIIIIFLVGVVAGGFISEYAGTIPYLSWLQYGKEFGVMEPIIVDMGILKITFAFTIKFTIGGILGIIISIIIYKIL